MSVQDCRHSYSNTMRLPHQIKLLRLTQDIGSKTNEGFALPHNNKTNYSTHIHE